ncbi:hypothetical protein C0992_003180 [Termitomyces sp. T32_za158]|nr:hypothetical protein C0992_003180 [Termitomyces sp. T32_za158]
MSAADEMDLDYSDPPQAPQSQGNKENSMEGPPREGSGKNGGGDGTTQNGAADHGNFESDFPELPMNASIKPNESEIPQPWIKLRAKKDPRPTHSQPQENESSKRQQPPSPARGRNTKRHASNTDMQFLSPEDHPHDPESSPAPLLDQMEDPTAHRSASYSLPPSQARFAFSDAFAKRNTLGPFGPPTPMYYSNRNGGVEADGVTMDQSATAVADSAWDDLLRSSPPSSPTHPTHGAINHHNEKGYRYPKPTRATEKEPHRRYPDGSPAPPTLSESLGRRLVISGIHADVKTEAHITTNTSGIQRTATPDGGWPKIHLVSSPMDNVAKSQIEAWRKVTTTKLWARLFRGKYEPNSLETVDKTRALIKGLIRVESDVALGVSFPLQELASGIERFPSPYHMLISGLTTEQSVFLTSLEVVSTKDITLIFKPFLDQRPSFVLTICGLTFHDSEEAREVVEDLVKTRIKESEAVMKHIVDSAPMLKERVARDIFSNISVKFLEVKRGTSSGGNFRGWNVYLHHSFLSNEDHIKLIQLMRTCEFPSATAGFGLPLRGKDTLLCTNCKSIDHDSPNCPFPDIPGWLGYKPAPTSADQDPMNAYLDGETRQHEGSQWRRGRGWGRGRGGRGGAAARRGYRGQWY